jgi:hypothetical protein
VPEQIYSRKTYAYNAWPVNSVYANVQLTKLTRPVLHFAMQNRKRAQNAAFGWSHVGLACSSNRAHPPAVRAVALAAEAAAYRCWLKKLLIFKGFVALTKVRVHSLKFGVQWMRCAE